MSQLVFISYSSKDKLVADAICSRLESQNIRCWIAPRDVNPGEDYSTQIVEALDRCSVVVIVFSSWANQSRHVKNEVDRAFNLNRIIIPFRVDKAEPDKGLAYYLAKTHWLDAITPPLDQHIRRLAQTINRLSGKDSLPKISPTDVQGKPVSARSKKVWLISIAIALAVTAMIATVLVRSGSNNTADAIATATSQSTTAPSIVTTATLASPSAQSRLQPTIAPSIPTTETPAAPFLQSQGSPAGVGNKPHRDNVEPPPDVQAQMDRDYGRIVAIPSRYYGKHVELVGRMADAYEIEGKLVGNLTTEAPAAETGRFLSCDLSKLSQADKELVASSPKTYMKFRGRLELSQLLGSPTLVIDAASLVDTSDW